MDSDARLPRSEPAEHPEREERRRRLDWKLRLLRPEHRTLLTRRDIEGLPYDEIAAVLSVRSPA